MVFSIFFCTFAMYKRGGLDHKINPIYLPLKHTIMNKTWKTILTFIELVISFLLARDKGQKADRKS